MPYRILLLLLLPIIAFAVLWDGLHYKPEEISFKSKETLGTSEAAGRLPRMVSGREQKNPPRLYDKKNLYEYVNGHAEFFISAGFTSLAAADYFSASPDPSFVVDIYHMGSPENAFGVFVEEKGENVQTVQAGFQGYSAGNLLCFIRGAYYVKISLFDKGLDILSLGREVGAAFQDVKTEIREFNLLPGEGSVQGSEAFVKEDFMGQEFLKDVYVKEYEKKGERYKAFVCRNQFTDGTTAFEKWLRFFKEAGTAVEAREEEGLKYCVVHDPFEGDLALAVSESYLFGLAGNWRQGDGLAALLSKAN